ncbi:MAG: gliding motility protein GldD [Tannerella sp.]|jgi:gliding motility-associated lipoprotein GldD|nr:gliding motility protein GldD [Tannerella sp.]
MKCPILLLLFVLLLSSCDKKATTPKPRGLYRIDIPPAHYTDFTLEELPYAFEVSQLAAIELPLPDMSGNWINLVYESLNAKIYCSYRKMKKNELSVLDEECRELVVRSIKRADKINEQMYENPDINVYATLFFIDGETSSPVQFLLTDSTNHFFRGALYYQCPLNMDSLIPVTAYLRNDVIRLIQSFYWK